MESRGNIRLPLQSRTQLKQPSTDMLTPPEIAFGAFLLKEMFPIVFYQNVNICKRGCAFMILLSYDTNTIKARCPPSRM